MNKKTYTLAELVERSVPYFASNPDTPYLLATTHKGKFYLPDFESYAQHAVAKDREGEVLVIDRELILRPVGMSFEDALAEAGLVMVPVNNPDHPFVNGILLPADKVLPATLGELVATATHFTFPEPAAPVSKPEGVNITLDTRPLKAIVDAAVKRVTEATAEAPAKRKYSPRAAKPAATATATKTKATTKKTK